MKRIFITGGNSFLGHSLLPLLDGLDFWAPRAKEVNLLNYVELENAIKDYKPNIILHLAALCGGILANQNNPAEFLWQNSMMGLNIFRVAQQHSVPKIYSSGSVCMYPKYCPVPFKEDDILNGAEEKTNKAYADAKRLLLSLHESFRTQYGMGGAFLVPVNMYGPYDHFDLVNSHVVPALINKFCNAVDKNLPTVSCWGTGTATRELIFCQDVAGAFVKAITLDLDTPLPINIGTGHDISIKALASLIGKLTGFKGETIFTGEVSDGQPKRKLDVSRAKELFGFEAKTSLLEGLSRTIDWYQTTKKEA